MQQQLTGTKQVSLYFKDINKLWAFARRLANPNLEINITQKKLDCTCSPAEIEKAVVEFDAFVILDGQSQL